MKKIPWNMRKKWILIFYTVFVVIAMFTFVLHNYYKNQTEMETEMEQTQQALLSQVSQNISLRLNYIDKQLTALCTQPETEAFFSGLSTDIQEIKRNVSLMENSDKSIESVYMMSLADNMIYANSNFFTLSSFYDTGWISDADVLKKKRVVWTTQRNINNNIQNNNTTVISMLRTYPLITTTDKIRGYIVVNINTDLLNQIVEESMQSIGSSFMILDMQNNVLARSQNYFTYNEEKILEGLSDNNKTPIISDGKKMFFVKDITFDAADWKIVSITPCDSMLENVHSLRNTSIFIAVIVSLSIMLIILISNKWMNAPVDKFMGMVVKKIEKDENHKINNFEELGNMFLYMVTQQHDLQSEFNKSIPFIKYQLMLKMISDQTITYEAIQPQLDLVKVRLYPFNYIVMISDFADKDIIDIEGVGAEFEVYISSLYNKAEELVNQENRGFSVQLPNNMCFTIISFETDNVQQNTIEALGIAEMMTNFMKDYYGIRIITAIGDHYNNFSGIRSSYEEALRLIKYKSVIGHNNVITKEDIQTAGDLQGYKMSVPVEKLTRAFESGNFDKTMSVLDEIFKKLEEEKQPSDIVIQISMQLIRECMECYREAGFEVGYAHYRNIDVSINQIETTEEIKTFIGHLISEMMSDISKKKMTKGSDELITKIVEYVNETYAEYDMSLNLLADRFGISVPYLSKIFKMYTQKTFTEYLIEIRLKKAAELLVNSNKKVNEISNEVGYPNPSSFIRIFKKYYYITPVDYRIRYRSKDEE